MSGEGNGSEGTRVGTKGREGKGPGKERKWVGEGRGSRVRMGNRNEIKGWK